MNKSAVAGALLALTGTALVAPPAAAADLPAPTVDNITTDQMLSEIQPLIVSGLDPSAVSIRVSYAGRVLDPIPVDPPGSPTVTTEIETWGLAGNNEMLVVSQCIDADATDCGAPTDPPISTRVDNPEPTYDLSPQGTEFSEPFDLTAHLAVTTGNPRLRLTLDVGTPVFVDPEDVTPVDTDALVEGPHQIAIDVCSADELRCTPGVTKAFDVVRSVAGSFSLSAPALSPNGDGQFDTIDFDYTQVDIWDSASVVVRNAAAEVVFTSDVPLPVPSNDGTFPYDGKDEFGVALPDGAYTATLTVGRTLDSGDPAESTYAPQPFTVDTTALAPSSLSSQWPTLYPYVDYYRDSTKFTYAGLEPYSRVDLKVRNAAGKLVRSKVISKPADATWNGRRNDGSRVREGNYFVRLRVVDNLGNVGLSPVAPVTVSDKKLVTVTKAVTVTPKASRVGGVVGACSTRRTPSLHGWAGSTGYLSNTRCRTTFNASIVWTHNQVKLPRAVTYRDVRLGWYGGPTKAASHHRAIATLYRKDGTPQGWFSSVDYMASQYIPWVKGWRVVDDGVVSWGFQTGRGNRYDVKSFTITYRADVLR